MFVFKFHIYFQYRPSLTFRYPLVGVRTPVLLLDPGTLISFFGIWILVLLLDLVRLLILTCFGILVLLFHRYSYSILESKLGRYTVLCFIFLLFGT